MTAISQPRRTWMIGLPLLVWIGCSLLVISPGFPLKGDQLSTAVTLDLTLTAPLLYFLVIRGTGVPKMTVLRVFIAGILLAGLLLHNRPHFFLSLLKTWLAPLAEGVLLFIIAKKFYHAGRSAKDLAEEEKNDFLSRCRVILKEITGNERAGYILASEMAVLYYAFLPQKKRRVDDGAGKRRVDGQPGECPGHTRRDIGEWLPGRGASAFTSYKTNGILLILGVLLCSFFVETAGLHFLLGLWSKKLAWILTALSAYTALQLYAHMRAIRSRPILVGDQSLQLYNGLAADVSVRIDNIEQIEMPHVLAKETSRAPGKAMVKLALLKGLENHNILIKLKQPVLVNRIFGIRQNADTLLFFVDRAEDFLSVVRAKMPV